MEAAIGFFFFFFGVCSVYVKCETECPGSQVENYPGLTVSCTSDGKVPLDDTKGAIWRDGVF